MKFNKYKGLPVAPIEDVARATGRSVNGTIAMVRMAQQAGKIDLGVIMVAGMPYIEVDDLYDYLLLLGYNWDDEVFAQFTG